MDDFINTIDVLGEQVVEDLLLTGELTEFADIRLKSPKHSAIFGSSATLKAVHLPLMEITSQQDILTKNTVLESVRLPSCRVLQHGALEDCTALKRIVLPSIEILYQNAFKNCTLLEALVLPNKFKVCNCATTNNFTGTPIEAGTGYIYVPKEMADGSDCITAYSSATNWSVYAGQFRYIEDYPEILAKVKEEVPWY